MNINANAVSSCSLPLHHDRCMEHWTVTCHVTHYVKPKGSDCGSDDIFYAISIPLKKDLRLLGCYDLSNTLRRFVESSHAGSRSLRRKRLLDHEVEDSTILPNNSSCRKSTRCNLQKDGTSSRWLSEPHISELHQDGSQNLMLLNFINMAVRTSYLWTSSTWLSESHTSELRITQKHLTSKCLYFSV